MLYQHLLSKRSKRRDGASAQYGSDVAGVININVKKATNKFDIAPLREAKFQRIK
jgi:iron complex outermembrane receptor protein